MNIKILNYDFVSLVEEMLKHDLIILATPVYWYSMSATMKIFIDRISDLLDVKKDLGRQLRNIYVIASFGTSLPKDFESPFSQTCEYLGMNYLGTSFIYSGQNLSLLGNNSKEISKLKDLLL